MTTYEITELLIIATILIWIGWDIYAYKRGGVEATESRVIYRWARRYPGFVFAVGCLMGHFFLAQHICE